VLLYGGLRPTEALVFRWTDVDGDKLRVQRGLIRNKGGGWTLDEPKTGRRRRTVTLPSPAVEALTAHRVNRPSDGLPRVRRGRITVSSVREAGEPLFLRNLTRRHFDKVLTAAGLPRMSLYDLRHTSASLLLAAGERPQGVSERLGHSSITLTLDTYSHDLPDMQQQTAAKLEALLS
jgi:integrase